MKTSNFANIKNLENFACISLYPPSWYVGPDLKSLAPTPELFHSHRLLTQEEYGIRYKTDVLDKLDCLKTYESIVKRCGEDVVLLCFEKPGDFCHRRLAAKWFEDNLNISVPEWEPKQKRSSLIF